MPVLDEWVQNNLTGAMRFTGVFFFIVGLLVAPGVLALSLLIGLVIYVSGLFGPAGRGEIQ
jgi:hypothetical protein